MADAYERMLRKYKQPIPDRPADGEWFCQQDWVNRATRCIGGTNALCVDAANRICAKGADFQRAEDEGTYPVRYYHGAGGATLAEMREDAARMRKNHRARYR